MQNNFKGFLIAGIILILVSLFYSIILCIACIVISIFIGVVIVKTTFGENNPNTSQEEENIVKCKYCNDYGYIEVTFGNSTTNLKCEHCNKE